VFISVMCVSASNVAYAQDEKKEFEALVIGGVITSGEDALDSVRVDLYELNEVIESDYTTSSGKFKFKLQNDMIYTIELVKEGYYTKRISVNTKLPPDYEGKYNFSFDINMDSKQKKVYDPYLAEYPSALIIFDEGGEEFTFDRSYTRSYFDEIERYDDAQK